jgi:UDP:flavonoid glycosyltransferase YjiC (YdhE family)
VAHIGFVSAAYWGDVMPFVPIADELAARGHRVSFVVPEGFHDVLDGHAFDLIHLGTDFSPRELADHGDVMEHADTVRGMRQALDLWIRQLTIVPAERIVAVLGGVDPDLWVSHNTCAWLVELHAAPASRPLVVGHLFPMMIPSGHQTPPMLPVARTRSRSVNRLAWSLGRTMTRRLMYDREINALRAARGLAPARDNAGFSWERADRILVLSSERYWPRPPDWPPHAQHTGFTVWGGVDDELAPDLDAYLAAGDPPVVMTMGTSAATNARDAFALGADAIEEVGRRPLLLVGNERNRDQLVGREDVWVFAPIRPVLARSRAIIHTGGHGTTAAALHAGIPQVLLPQGFDQVVHARRLEELGVGVVVPWKERSLDALTDALHRVAGAAMRAHARDLAGLLADEDGPATAAAAVEDVLALA